jgi:hypothetical protein
VQGDAGHPSWQSGEQLKKKWKKGAEEEKRHKGSLKKMDA